MKFYKVEVEVSNQVEELLAYNLNNFGIDGVEIINDNGISDKDKEKMFIDILPENKNSNISILRFFIPLEESIDKYTNIVEGELVRLSEFFDVGSGSIVVSEVDDVDWKDRWKEYFKPFFIDEVLISPTWIESKNDDGILINIDPGSAFGTGLHETTRLCIRALKKNIKTGDYLLDIGCGSGILSILASKLGCNLISAIDIDELAVRTTKENLDINSVYNVETYVGDIITNKDIDAKLGYGKYDVIVANLLAEIIINMSSLFIPHLKHDGILITSGILKEKEEKVTKSLKESGFNEFDIVEDGEWISIIAKR